MERDKLFERCRAAKTMIATVNNPKHAEDLELQAFMAIFHPDKQIEPGTRRITDRKS